MGIDLSKIKSRLDSFQKTQTKTSVFWKPEMGRQVIRIVPYLHNPSDPFFEGYFYYNLSKRTILSPETFGDRDPVIEFANNLKRTGEKEDWRAAKRMEPKLRTYVPIVVRGQENEGVKFWGFGKTVYQELLAVMSDPDYGDISHPLTGRDITVEYISSEEAGKSYPETRIRVKPNQTPLHEDEKVVASLLNNQQKIEELWSAPTYGEMEKLLQNWLDPSNEAEEAESNDSGGGDSFTLRTNSADAAPWEGDDEEENVPRASKERATAVQQVSDDFDKLFGSGK